MLTPRVTKSPHERALTDPRLARDKHQAPSSDTTLARLSSSASANAERSSSATCPPSPRLGTTLPIAGIIKHRWPARAGRGVGERQVEQKRMPVGIRVQRTHGHSNLALTSATPTRAANCLAAQAQA